MNRKQPRTTWFETLEQRRALAGDVSVAVLAGQLFITGDSQSNDIVLTATGVPGQFTIASGSYTATTINGGGPVTVSGAVSHVFANLGAGNDQIIFNSAPAAISFFGNVHIDMGAEYDTVQGYGANPITVAGSFELTGAGINNVYLASLHIGGGLDITLGNSLDHVVLDSGTVGGSVSIDSGAGNDTIQMEMTVAGDVQLTGSGDDEYWLADMVTPTVIGGSLLVDLDAGALNIFNVQVGHNLNVQGSGDVRMGYSDVSGSVQMNLTGGVSSVALGPLSPSAPDVQQFGGNVVIDLGTAGGNVNIDSASVANDLIIRAGDGNNNVNVTNVRAGNAFFIDVGAGNDSVRIATASCGGEATVMGGSGGDYLAVTNFAATRSFAVDAAAGYDLVSFTYCSVGRTLSISSGADGDQVTVSVVRAQNLWLDSGAGYDAVRIEYSALDTLYAQLGDGGDSLNLRANLVRIAAALDGGAGYDLLSWSGNLLAGLDRRNFEATVT